MSARPNATHISSSPLLRPLSAATQFLSSNILPPTSNHRLRFAPVARNAHGRRFPPRPRYRHSRAQRLVGRWTVRSPTVVSVLPLNQSASAATESAAAVSASSAPTAITTGSSVVFDSNPAPSIGRFQKYRTDVHGADHNHFVESQDVPNSGSGSHTGSAFGSSIEMNKLHAGHCFNADRSSVTVMPSSTFSFCPSLCSPPRNQTSLAFTLDVRDPFYSHLKRPKHLGHDIRRPSSAGPTFIEDFSPSSSLSSSSPASRSDQHLRTIARSHQISLLGAVMPVKTVSNRRLVCIAQSPASVSSAYSTSDAADSMAPTATSFCIVSRPLLHLPAFGCVFSHTFALVVLWIFILGVGLYINVFGTPLSAGAFAAFIAVCALLLVAVLSRLDRFILVGV
jgi:hypothetical protein